ncbi:MAG: 5-formyltetrahydrofolate cyclo-ligase [Thaumarchaeota archaeon]|nr:5-formyltetrahydrofolate cyclo-ligase [Nitrososphaerota archaeon]
MSKSQLRAQAIAARRAIPHALLVQESRLVEENLASQDEYRDARLVASYVSKEDEVRTDEIIGRMFAEGKRVAVPLMETRSVMLVFLEIHGLGELSMGHFGILEPGRDAPPVPLNVTDLVLVPLVAWDDRGHRIGYGKGYFDRALAGRGRSLAVGLAMESQRIQKVPEGPSDVRLDMVVTEKRALRFERGAA